MMKNSKTRPIASGLVDSASEPEVQREIENFLQAVTSYPEQFASNPNLSFEQHLCSFSSAGRISSTGGERRRKLML